MAVKIISNLQPRCIYCRFGEITPLERENPGSEVVCRKRGVVETDFKCSKYKYDPTKREPEARTVFKKPAFEAGTFDI